MGGLYPGGLINRGLISGWTYKQGAYIRVGL